MCLLPISDGGGRGGRGGFGGGRGGDRGRGGGDRYVFLSIEIGT